MGTIHVWCDIIERRDGGIWLAFTWRHLLFDGVGAEWLLTEAARLAAGDGTSYVTSDAITHKPPGGAKIGYFRRWRLAHPMVKRLYELLEKPFKSLGGGSARAGRICFATAVLNEAQTEKVNARAAELCGPLINNALLFGLCNISPSSRLGDTRRRA